MKRKYGIWSILFIVSTFAAVALVNMVVYKEVVQEWQPYQREYYQRLAEVTGDPERAKEPLGIKQIYMPKLNRVDRCITCHVGVSNPNMAGQPAPFGAHPDLGNPEFLKAHPFEEIGCTVCHDGQGRATTVKHAHGRDLHHWEKPMLPKGMTAANCAVCHEDTTNLQGAEALKEAHQIFEEKGCIGCHMLNGWGNQIGPELSDTGLKNLHQFDFRHVYGGHSKIDWIYEHFIDPQRVTPEDRMIGIPETPMPNYEFTEHEASVLTALVLSFSAAKENPLRPIPHSFKVEAEPKVVAVPEDSIAYGRQVYEKFGCAGCHGQEGRGGVYSKNMDLGAEEPTLIYVSEAYSREDIKAVIREGKFPARAQSSEMSPAIWMPGFGKKMSEAELDALTDYLISLSPEQSNVKPKAKKATKKAVEAPATP